MTHPLDNPIWQALTTSQAQFAEICGLARRFPSDITSLGAFSAPSPEAYDSLAGLAGAGEVIIGGSASLRVGRYRWRRSAARGIIKPSPAPRYHGIRRNRFS